MNTVKKISLATALGIFAVFASTSSIADGAPDVSGTYSCSWHDPVSTPSSGTEQIVLKNGDVYIVKMIG